MADQQDPQGFDLSTSPSHLLHRAQQAAVNLSTEALAAQGLTLRQFAVLAALASEEGQSQSSLVDRTGIDRSTLAEMVRRMEASGYIERTTSPEDARAKAVSLLAKGREVYDAALPGVEAADKALLAMIRSSRRAGFILSLAAIGAPEEEPMIEDVVVEEAADAGPGKDTKVKPKKSKKDKAAKADKSKSDKKKKKKKKK